MPVLMTKRLKSILMSTLGLGCALVVATGCGGGKKTVQTEVSPPPPPVISAEPATPETSAPAPVKKAPVRLPLESVHFDFDKYGLRPEARDILAKHARVLKQHSEVPVVIEGHCDERGTVEYNLALGEKRAKAVKDYLVSLGVDRSRLTTISFGKERPVEFGHNEMAWARNRRAEFVIKTEPSFSDNN
jgi:peptidoglycan-associated lipoprotein